MGRVGNSYAGRVAIVTGGASGIGRAMGLELYGRGARVVLADIDVGPIAAVTHLIESQPHPGAGSIETRALDVRDKDAVKLLVDDVAATYGRLDFMFNNAGISVGGPTHEIPASHWDRIIDVNIRGVVNGVVAAYPRMIDQGHGHIVNTASGAGLAPMPLTVPYTMTKHAVVGLSTALRPEAARYGVRVSVVCPGAVDTPILDSTVPTDLPPMPEGTPTGREFMKQLGIRPMPVSRFAPRALRGIARNQAVVVVPASTSLLWYLHRISPRATERIGRWMVDRVST